MEQKQLSKRKLSNPVCFYQCGFNVRNINSIAKQYLCGFCALVIRAPVRALECGHHLCQSCVDIQERDAVICLDCQSITNKKDYLPDRDFRNEMDIIFVECMLCIWNGPLKEYQEHLNQSHPKLICDQCGAEFNSAYCLKVHGLRQCVNNTSYKFIVQFIEKYLKKQCQIERPNSSYRKLIEPTMKKKKNDETLSEIFLQKDESTVFSSTTSEDQHIVPVDNNTTVQPQNQDEILNVPLKKDVVVSDELQPYPNENPQNFMESRTQNWEEVASSIRQLHNVYNELKNNQNNFQQQLALFQQEVDHPEFITYDGTLIWKVTNFQNRMRNAQSQTISIDSIPFYTSTAGYKIRVGLYLNGYDDTQDTHLSISFTLMQGEYDPILTFPFPYKVSFCLFNQISQQGHLIESFRPDEQSNCFQRPRCEMNLSKIIKLCPLYVLQQSGNPYVQNDSIFIKVMINTDYISQDVLLYAFTLESGLSMKVQKVMIRKQQKKREQIRAALIAKNNRNDRELSQAIFNTMRSRVVINRRRQSLTTGSRGMSPEDGRDDDRRTS